MGLSVCCANIASEAPDRSGVVSLLVFLAVLIFARPDAVGPSAGVRVIVPGKQLAIREPCPLFRSMDAGSVMAYSSDRAGQKL